MKKLISINQSENNSFSNSLVRMIDDNLFDIYVPFFSPLSCLHFIRYCHRWNNVPFTLSSSILCWKRIRLKLLKLNYFVFGTRFEINCGFEVNVNQKSSNHLQNFGISALSLRNFKVCVEICAIWWVRANREYWKRRTAFAYIVQLITKVMSNSVLLR